MAVILKKMETEDEIRGKAYVAWRSWHETYPGLVSRAYLDALTLEKCEAAAFRQTEGFTVAKDGERVVGFIGCGPCGQDPSAGEIFALYVLTDDQGRHIGTRLMEAALGQLGEYPEVRLWVVKGNERALRFYRKFGFEPDGAEKYSEKVGAAGVRMALRRTGGEA